MAHCYDPKLSAEHSKLLFGGFETTKNSRKNKTAKPLKGKNIESSEKVGDFQKSVSYNLTTSDVDNRLDKMYIYLQISG